MLWFGVRWTVGPGFTGRLWNGANAPSDGGIPEAVGEGNTAVGNEKEQEQAQEQAKQITGIIGNCINVGPYLQSERRELYDHAWKLLYDKGHIYPSSVSRKQIEQALSAPHEGEGEVVFPTALRVAPEDVPVGLSGPDGQSWRFRVPDGEVISFTDAHLGPVSFTAGVDFGDFLIWRFDGIPSYMMAVVVDDMAMGITEIVRGEDLLMSTARQILIYRAFGIANINLPQFFHCPLVRDPDTGMRLAKRDGSTSLRNLAESGMSPDTIREKLCCFSGVVL
jgi:glutamyl/glutaminyl-tRNA synthetase